MSDTTYDEQHDRGGRNQNVGTKHISGLSAPAEAISPESNRLWHILDAIPIGVCITDHGGRFEYVNPHYRRLYGYSSEQLLGRHFTLVVPDSDKERLSHLHNAFIEAGGGAGELRGEWNVHRADGTPLTILADAAYLEDTEGKPKKVTFVVDITERKHMEGELQDTISELHGEIQERRRLEATKQEVERMMRHDLRNPLNGILTAADLLLREDLPESRRELVLAIRDSGHRLDTMISSSMDYVRMEEGSYELDPQPVNLLDVFRAVESQLSSILSGSTVELSYSLDGEDIDWNSSLPMYGEVIYLEELFANLLRNAVEASHTGDTVSIRISKKEREGKIYAYLVDVHNTMAVPEAVRERFFERYATSGKKAGNGLGTYIASLIARTHNGTIRFETDEETGTDVYVELPVLPIEKEGV